MSVLWTLAKEIIGMFLADGRLPVWLIAWIAIIAILTHAVAELPMRGALLLGGVMAILATNVLSSARAASPRRPG